MDYFNYISNDWFGYFEIKIMPDNKNIFVKKKILIYGLGKSGFSSYLFLRKKMIFIYMMIIKILLKIKKLKNY